MTSTYIPMHRRKIIGLVLITSLATFSLLNCRLRPTRLDREHVPGPLAAKSWLGFFSKTAPAVPIDWERSLLIRNPLVVDDREYACDVYRATNANAQAPCPLDKLGVGPLTFAAAFKSLTAPKTGQAAAWMDVFRKDPYGEAIYKSWISYSPSLQLEYAPFRLLAVVYRPDLARDPKSGGEVRLVFCAYDQSGLVVNIDFYVIFEFAVTVRDWDEFKAWAGRWADLSQAPPSAAAVKSLVEAGIAKSGSRKLRVNYNRGGAWHVREFTAQTDGTLLPPANLTATPSAASPCNPALATWILSQRNRYLTEDAPVAVTVTAALAATDLDYGGTAWTPYQLSDDLLRSAFALSTCNGCHASETNVGFAHIAKREVGQMAAVSKFLLPVIVPAHKLTSPCDSSQVIQVDKRDYADLDRRIKIMEKILTSVSSKDFQSIKWTRQVH